MPVGHTSEVMEIAVELEGAEGVKKRSLIGPEQGWDSHIMRVFELEKGGQTPLHAHAWPHVNYMLEGEGVLHIDGEDHPVRPGSYAVVEGGKEHQFRNAGEVPFIFICIVPKGRDY